MESANDQPISDKRDGQIESVVTSLIRNQDELDHLRYMILQRRLLEVRVGTLIIVATILFATTLLLYVGMWSDPGIPPTSAARWITVALMILFFASAWTGATVLMNIERRTKLYEKALDQRRQRTVKAQTETAASMPETVTPTSPETVTPTSIPPEADHVL